MGYQQHNSPFRGTYSNPAGTTNNQRVVPDLTQGLVVPDNVTAEGEDENIDATNVNQNASILDQPDDISTAAQNIRANSSMNTKLGEQHRRANDPHLNPRQRGRAAAHEKKTRARHERQEKKWELKNQLTQDKIDKSNPDKLAKIEERQANRRARALKNDKINAPLDEKMDWSTSSSNITNPFADKSITTNYDESQQTPQKFQYSDFMEPTVLDEFEIVTPGPKMKQTNNSPSMKHINSMGSAFPMVNPDGEDPTVIPPNRAGGAVNKNKLTQPTTSVQDQFQSAYSANQADMMSNIASSEGTPLPTDDNANDQIAVAQENLGTDAATNTDVPAMGGSGMSMNGPAKKDWIQEGIDSGGIKEGGLHKTLGIPEDQTIPYAKKVAASKSDNPKERKQGKLALTFAKLSKKRKK